MIPLFFSPPGSTARTRRGERPVKTRHPQSRRSTDVMKGSRTDTHSNNTTTSFISTIFQHTNRHQNASQKRWTVEFAWMTATLFFALGTSPLRRGVEPRSRTLRMRDHEDSLPLFNPHIRIEKGVLHGRKSAGHRLDPGRYRRKPARADLASSPGSRAGLRQMNALAWECHV